MQLLISGLVLIFYAVGSGAGVSLGDDTSVLKIEISHSHAHDHNSNSSHHHSYDSDNKRGDENQSSQEQVPHSHESSVGSYPTAILTSAPSIDVKVFQIEGPQALKCEALPAPDRASIFRPPIA